MSARKSKYNATECADVRDWVESVIGDTLPEGDPIGVLKDGIALCKVVNTIQPKSALSKQSKMPFVQMENIAAFLRACEKIGVPHHELFETVDLYEMKDPIQVAITVRSLSRHAHLKNPSIPVIGPKLKGTPSKQFNSEFKKDTAEIPAWNSHQYGFIGGANQSSEGVVIGAHPGIIQKEIKSPPKSPNIMIQRDTSINSTLSPSPSDRRQKQPVASPEDTKTHTAAPEAAADNITSDFEPSGDQSWQYSPTVTRKTLAVVEKEHSSIADASLKDASIAGEPNTSVALPPQPSFNDEEPSFESDRSILNPPDFTHEHEEADGSIQSEDQISVKPVSAFSPSPQRSPLSKTTQRHNIDVFGSPTRSSRLSLGDYDADEEEPEQSIGLSQPVSINLRPANRPKGPRTFQPSPTIQSSSSVFGNDDDDVDDHSYGTTGKANNNLFRDKMNKQLIEHGKKSIIEAEQAANEYDSSVYAYDEVYDVMKEAENKVLRQKIIDKHERKPRYIENLLESRSQREMDRQRAKDVQLRREREAEGDDLSSKEMFVTSAYKKQQELLETQRKEEESRDANNKRDMKFFHGTLLEREEEARAKVLAAVSDAKLHSPSGNVISYSVEADDSLSSQARRVNRDAGYEKVKINENGEIIDSRQLLTGGLNISQRPRDLASRGESLNISSRSHSYKGRHEPFHSRQRSRHAETGLHEEKRSNEQENEKEERKAKLAQALTSHSKDVQTVSSARERYLARKKAAETAENDVLPHKFTGDHK